MRGTLFQALSCFSRLFDFGILIWAYARLWSSRQAGKPLRKICKTPQLSGAGRAPAGSGVLSLLMPKRRERSRRLGIRVTETPISAFRSTFSISCNKGAASTPRVLFSRCSASCRSNRMRSSSERTAPNNESSAAFLPSSSRVPAEWACPVWQRKRRIPPFLQPQHG